MFNFLNWLFFKEEKDLVKQRFDFIMKAREKKNRIIWSLITLILLFFLLVFPFVLKKYFYFEFFWFYYVLLCIFAFIIFTYYVYIQFTATCYKCVSCEHLFFRGYLAACLGEMYLLKNEPKTVTLFFRPRVSDSDETLNDMRYIGYTVVCPNCHKKMFRSDAKYKLK